MPTHLKLFIKINVSLSNSVIRKYEIIKSDENDKSVEGFVVQIHLFGQIVFKELHSY